MASTDLVPVRDAGGLAPAGVMRRNISSIASAIGRIGNAGVFKQFQPPGTNAGWGSSGHSKTALTHSIREYIATYGGSEAVTWIYACCTLVMDEMAMYPYDFVDPSSAADMGKATPISYKNVPQDLKDLLKQPNPGMTWFDFINYMTMDLELVGNSYWLKDQQNGFGQPLTLLRLRPEYMQVATDIQGRVIGYLYRIKGLNIPYNVDEVIHFKYPSPHSEYYGMGKVQGVIQDAGIELGVNQNVIGFFANGARISGVLSINGTLQDHEFERMKKQFRDEYLGPSNAFSILIAEQGLRFQPITQTPSATGITDIRNVTQDAILAGWGIHKDMLGGGFERTSPANSDAWKIFTRKMRPRARRLSERITYDLTAQWGQIGVWISTTDIETQEVKVARARDMLGAGASVNESRITQGLPIWNRENFPWITEEEERLAWTPTLPSGYEPYYVNQQGGGSNILPGGSNGNANGSTNPTSDAGDTSRDRQATRGVKIFRGLSGKALMQLSTGDVLNIPDGLEQVDLSVIKEAALNDAEQLVAAQARILTEEPPAWELDMIGFFNEQRNRVLREASKFTDAHNAKRLGKIDKREMDIGKIWNVGHEDDILRGLYRTRALGVAQRTVNEISVIFDTPVAEIRGIVDEIGSRIVGINQTTRDRIAKQIALGISRGYSRDQIANGVPDENYLGVSGVFDSATQHRAKTIATTETAFVYNLASLSSYAQIGVRRVEVLDGTGDEECRQAAGQVWSLEHARENPTQHPNCIRSFVPIMTGTGR